jgi:hypothetical protein
MSISIFDSICPQYGSALLVTCFEPSKYSSDKYFSTLCILYTKGKYLFRLEFHFDSYYIIFFGYILVKTVKCILSLQLFGLKICSRARLLTVQVHAVYFFFVFEYMSEDIINTDLVGWLCFDHSFYYNIFILETKAQ